MMNIDLPRIAIEPMTKVNVVMHEGYFSDPYPIHFAPKIQDSVPLTFSGTTQNLLSSSGAIRPECFQKRKIEVAKDLLQQQAHEANTKIASIAAIHPYQNRRGEWDMVLALKVESQAANTDANAKQDQSWTVIAHAMPTDNSLPVPTTWKADKLLVGSFTTNQDANYNGKYFEDDGKLYLIYSKRLSPPTKPARDGIVAQLMQSPTELANKPPVTLLMPNMGANSLNSELYFENGADFKLVETGNIIKINGKYAMAYSTGAYNKTNYKLGIAWSDTFVPRSGSFYRKVLAPDPSGVWGNTKPEVKYLLQSQKPNWPNYVAEQVIAPGVPSIVEDKNDMAHRQGGQGTWHLYFAGYAPDDHPVKANGNFQGNHRRPYYTTIKVAVPDNITVDAASDSELAKWVTLVTR
ncbi:hypothetical protein [Nostoc sp. PA-18-2419]|uniref:hypothetical protein n=1 Tax=Nostoc sp. PA-18-2419 TaxID=2575443 RepID=UPI001108ABF0|nr:hypothetical protein [Nostoc sp. PA-18-2419]